MKIKTRCCGYEFDPEVTPGIHPGCPVYWNSFNLLIQCHNCGHVYVPDGLEPLIVAMERVTREEPEVCKSK